MIVKTYIKEFEKLGFGMFVHFGLYSILGKGEWSKKQYEIPDEEYYMPLMEQFDPKKDWAEELVDTARKAGCRYIVLTTRHHDGFSLYDTCGLNKLDAMHAKCRRDLVREFVDACRAQDIIPFFYHTLLDWYQESYQNDFPAYLQYLRSSVEILCTNYGIIGGLWFDGMWDKRAADWEEDALYACIRKHQPEAMIINNTGLVALGAKGHIELDSVTFERGKPYSINTEDDPKYLASEVCQVFGSYWGYSKEDLNFKSPAQLIKELAECRRYGANMLMNVGPMGNGELRLIEVASLGIMGEWVSCFEEAIRIPRPVDIKIENKPDDFLLRDGDNYFMFCYNLPINADANVSIKEHGDTLSHFELQDKISSFCWLDNGAEVEFSQEGNQVWVNTGGYGYGRNYVVRVGKIICKQ